MLGETEKSSDVCRTASESTHMLSHSFITYKSE